MPYLQMNERLNTANLPLSGETRVLTNDDARRVLLQGTEVLPPFDVRLERYRTPTGIDSSVMRWGDEMTIERRYKEMRPHMSPEDFDAFVLSKTGVANLYVNRYPQEQAKDIELAMVTGMVRNQLQEAEIDPSELAAIWTSRTVAPPGEPHLGDVIAQKIGARNAATLDFNAACAGGTLAYLNLLKQEEFRGKQCLLVADENMLGLVDGFDPTKIDPMTAGIFTQGAMSRLVIPGVNATLLGGDYFFKTYPDRGKTERGGQGYLSADPGYTVVDSGIPGMEIVYRDDKGLRVGLPTPPPGFLMYMVPQVGGFFLKIVGDAIPEARDGILKGIWDKATMMEIHSPNSSILNKAAFNLLSSHLLPPRVAASFLRGVPNIDTLKPDELNKLLLSDFATDETRALKREGLGGFPDARFYPKHTKQGNATTAQLPITMAQNSINSCGKTVAEAGFGGGGSVVLGVVDYALMEQSVQ